MRLNLDPHNQASGAEMTSVLERVVLGGLLEIHGRDGPVDWDKWSSGQRQMFCFPKAMMKRSKSLSSMRPQATFMLRLTAVRRLSLTRSSVIARYLPFCID
ncbi:hypothetical protein LX36DRAFT_377692 [Colletotrichum falcatum]|nr:hypothetical protein LX36DRAFT_377692 [Colletotrichum falcatum]